MGFTITGGMKLTGMLASKSSYVTSGLIMYLDAGNSSSYPGTGTTITDLTGNGYNGTLVNSPTYSSSYGGVIQTNGSNSYITANGINLASSTYTMFGAARYTNSATGRMITAKNNNWLMGHWNGTTQNYYAEGWVSNSGSGPSDTNWRIYAATWNSSTDSASLYVNDVLTAGPNANAAAGPNGIWIGASGIYGEYAAGQFGFLMAYNTILTTAQLTQNFNYFRNRYSL